MAIDDAAQNVPKGRLACARARTDPAEATFGQIARALIRTPLPCDSAVVFFFSFLSSPNSATSARPSIRIRKFRVRARRTCCDFLEQICYCGHLARARLCSRAGRSLLGSLSKARHLRSAPHSLGKLMVGERAAHLHSRACLCHSHLDSRPFAQFTSGHTHARAFICDAPNRYYGAARHRNARADAHNFRLGGNAHAFACDIRISLCACDAQWTRARAGIMRVACNAHNEASVCSVTPHAL